MEAGMQIELYKIDNKRNIIIVTIKEITDELRKQIDKYICRIWAGQNEKDIKYVKKEILEYIEKKDMDFVNAILKDINNSYIADMAKYATTNETTKIMAVYNIISAQLAKENKKFQYKLIKSGARAYEYENAINWLNASGIINQCTKVKEGKLPLTAFIEPESFKIYMADVGLLSNKFGIPANIVMGQLRLILLYKTNKEI